MRQDFESLGDRLKTFEAKNRTYLMSNVPVYARLDGKNFNKFTKGMKYPHDETFRLIMSKIVAFLMKETNASLGFHQSDEISLFWESTDQMMFDNRVDKWIGELCGLAASYMMKETLTHYPNKQNAYPRFDCRVFNVVEKTAAEFFMWRQMDCIRNSVSMLASSVFSHKELLKKSTKERKKMLDGVGVSWDDYDSQFKFGTFIRKKNVLVDVVTINIPPEHLDKVPSKVMRSMYFEYVYSPIQNFDNIVDIMTHRFIDKSNVLIERQVGMV